MVRHAPRRFLLCCAMPMGSHSHHSASRSLATLSPPATEQAGEEAARHAAVTTEQAIATAGSLASALPGHVSGFSATSTAASMSGRHHRPIMPRQPSTAPDTVVRAWQEGKLGFSFSGGGFLLPYYAGAVHQLMHMGLIQPGVTPLGGSSAGSLIAACVNGGVPPETVLSTVLAVAANCRHHGVKGRLAGFLSAQLHEHLPHDAHVRCTGRAHVGITRMWPLPKSKVISVFHTKEELVAALMASCHIPLLSDGNMTTKFRGKTVVDGGITALIPPLPPSSCSHVVKVSCIPKAHIPYIPVMNKKAVLEGLAWAPDMFGREWPYSVQQTVEWTMGPGPHSFMVDLVQWGCQDALSWATEAGITAHLGADKAQLAPSLLGLVSEADPVAADTVGEAVREDPPSLQPTLNTALTQEGSMGGGKRSGGASQEGAAVEHVSVAVAGSLGGGGVRVAAETRVVAAQA